jgi:hypothetical protein
MPGVYQGLYEKTTIKPSETRSLPGVKIMGDVQGAANDMSNLFAAFCKYFRTQQRWTWNGGRVTPRGYEILDGVKNFGQCSALAQALRLLAILPKPFGAGIPEQEVGDPTVATGGLYQGGTGHGFVSVHSDLTSPGVVLGLHSNVFSPPVNTTQLSLVTAASPRNGLYLWENHKTVPHRGHYYDPSYGRIWDSKEQMAKYHMKDDSTAQRRVEVTAANKQKTTTYYAGVDVMGLDVYFRGLLPEEVQVTQCNGFQGPFTSVPGKPWDGPSVGFLGTKFSK